jgi:hypothetical protein
VWLANVTVGATASPHVLLVSAFENATPQSSARLTRRLPPARKRSFGVAGPEAHQRLAVFFRADYLPSTAGCTG